MNLLIKFKWDCGRMGRVEGLFITPEEILKENMDKDVYLGEVLGKHSDVYGKLESGDIVEISRDQELIEKLHSLFGNTLVGYNPLNYIQEQEND